MVSDPYPNQSRRRFLKHAGAATFASMPLVATARTLAQISLPATTPSAAAALRNQSPLHPNAFNLLPLGSIRPTGWLRDQLQIQRNGLGGHLDETWADVGPNSGWLGGTGESWERGPYFLDGLVPLAYLLDDARLKAKAQRWIDWTLTHQAANGMIGPAGNDDWWPRMVMLKVLTQYHEATADPRVLPVLKRYFAHQLSALPARPLRDWGKFRWQDNALSVLWLYNRQPDPKLLELVTLLHRQGFDWQADFANFKYTGMITPEIIKISEGNGLGDLALATHGVNNGQAIKSGAVWSVVSGKPGDRAAVHIMLAALDRYHGLPNGMFSCDEHLAGLNPSQGTELCTVVETMFSLEQSLAILGDAALGDRLERIAFNALPGTFADGMWTHQYNQECNQVECSLHRKPWTTDGPESGLYGLEPNFGCCTANFHQGWPKFTASLWMASEDDGLVAAAYSPCELRTTLGSTALHVSEQTQYPFRDRIRITINPAAPLAFPLRLRIPAWASGATITVNGKQQPAPTLGSFARIDRTWTAGDLVELHLPMTPKIATGFMQSATITLGPLVFSYPIPASWVKLRDRGMTADWQVFPAAQWNYALALHGQDAITVQQSPLSSSPFSLTGAPVTLTLNARKLLAWQAIDGVADAVPQSPVQSAERLETITLVPYAAAKLRITAFPRLDESTAS